MKVELMACTLSPLRTTYLACKVCTTTDADFEKCIQSVNKDEQAHIVQAVVKSGHESVLEHVSATFYIQGISRACSHQLVRHRLASYSQQSQRYTAMSSEDVNFIQPPSIDKNDMRSEWTLNTIQSYDHFATLSEFIPQEDARYILAEGTSTSLICTMNARELLHFFDLRCCNRAQWEIRILAYEMLDLCQDWFPEVFRTAGPKCERLGYCTEAKSCGKAVHIDELLTSYAHAEEHL